MYLFTDNLAAAGHHLQTQLATARQSHGSQGIFARNRFRIRRDHILEDAYNQMSALSEDDLRGSVSSCPICVF